MEMCQGSLHDIISHYSQKNKEPPNEEFKELLAIQMLDAVNLLHQRQIVHGNITSQHFLVSSSKGKPIFLKLCNCRVTSSVNPSNPAKSVKRNKALNIISFVEI